MEVYKNRELLVRKQFLMRAVANENMTEAEANKEIDELNAQIEVNMRESLVEQESEMKQLLSGIKKEQVTDGNMKRAIANELIKFLNSSFSKDEIKGIARQMYKIMRAG
jgi:hypothetical protein